MIGTRATTFAFVSRRSTSEARACSAVLCRQGKASRDGRRQRGLTESAFQHLSTEIDRLIEKGRDYSFAPWDRADRGWVFCPECAGGKPLEITPAGWNTRIFLFGPEAGFRPDIGGMP